jgi:hypothetical protein
MNTEIFNEKFREDCKGIEITPHVVFNYFQTFVTKQKYLVVMERGNTSVNRCILDQVKDFWNRYLSLAEKTHPSIRCFKEIDISDFNLTTYNLLELGKLLSKYCDQKLILTK